MKKWGGKTSSHPVRDAQSLELPAADETWGLEELVEHANRLLPRYLPTERDDKRVRDEVNARLVRHLTTLGVLDEAGKEGREARYNLRHLLQLLVARRLMAEGYTTNALKKWTEGASHSALTELLQRGLTPEALSAPQPPAPVAAPQAPDGAMATPAPASNPALDYLRSVREGQGEISYENLPASPARRRDATLSPARPLHDIEKEASEFGAGRFDSVFPELDAPLSPAPAAQPLPVPTAPAAVSRWERIIVEAGLEVHVRDDWKLPPTPHERDELLHRLLEQLKRLAPKRR